MYWLYVYIPIIPLQLFQQQLYYNFTKIVNVKFLEISLFAVGKIANIEYLCINNKIYTLYNVVTLRKVHLCVFYLKHGGVR